MPFLNWNTLKWNIKIDEASYESAKVDFEKSIVSSLNEIDTYYKSYQKANSSYALQEKNLKSQKEITKHYKNRYDNGNVEFKSWLEALVNEKDSELNLLKAKFDHFYLEIYKNSQIPSYFALQAVQKAYLPLLSRPLLFVF